jgi:hypothetical protein
MVPKASRPYMPGYGILDANDGLLPWEWAVERLTNSRNYWIATTSADGHAEQISDAETIRRFIEAYNPKYQWDLKPETLLDMGPLFAVRPRKVIAVDATPGQFQLSATRWLF